MKILETWITKTWFFGSYSAKTTRPRISHTLYQSSSLDLSIDTVANVNQGGMWDHIFVLLDKKEKRERGSRGNGCFGKKGRREERREKRGESR